LHRDIDRDSKRAVRVLAVLGDVRHRRGLDRAEARVVAAVVGHRLNLRGVLHVEGLESNDRHVDEHRRADADEDHAERVELVGISLRSGHGYWTSCARESGNVGSLVGIKLPLRFLPTPTRNTPQSASHTVISTGEKPTWCCAAEPVSGPATIF